MLLESIGPTITRPCSGSLQTYSDYSSLEASRTDQNQEMAPHSGSSRVTGFGVVASHSCG